MLFRANRKPQFVYVCSCEKRILNQTMGRPICPKECAVERKNNFINDDICSPDCREYGACKKFRHPELFMNVGCIENCVVHVIYDTETKEVLWAFYDESECIKRFDYIQNCCTTSRKLDWKSVNLKYLFK